MSAPEKELFDTLLDQLTWLDGLAVQAGAELTPAERAFLLEATPRFEECSYTKDELAAMSDADLISAAYSAWADYCR